MTRPKLHAVPTAETPPADADLQAHLQAIAEDRLWEDQINALVNWGFSTVSRNPSEHEASVAYRRVIASVLHHMRNGWGWEHGSFMGCQGWMWRRPAQGGTK